jgi:hypothetical protein
LGSMLAAYWRGIDSSKRSSTGENS